MAAADMGMTDIEASVLWKVKKHHSSPRARELGRAETWGMSRHRGVSACLWGVGGNDATAGQRMPAGRAGRVGFLLL